MDSVTDDNNDVVGIDPGRMGEGPGNDGAIELRDLVEDIGRSGSTVGLSDDNSLARSEEPNEDSGSGMFRALTLDTLEETMLPTSETVDTVVSSTGDKGKSGSKTITGGSGKGSGDLTRGSGSGTWVSSTTGSASSTSGGRAIETGSSIAGAGCATTRITF